MKGRNARVGYCFFSLNLSKSSSVRVKRYAAEPLFLSREPIRDCENVDRLTQYSQHNLGLSETKDSLQQHIMCEKALSELYRVSKLLVLTVKTAKTGESQAVEMKLQSVLFINTISYIIYESTVLFKLMKQ